MPLKKFFIHDSGWPSKHKGFFRCSGPLTAGHESGTLIWGLPRYLKLKDRGVV